MNMLTKQNKLIAFAFSAIALFSINAFAANSDQTQHVVVAPICLIKNLTATHTTLATDTKFSVLKLNNAGIDQLIAAKNNHKELCGGFVDVSHAWTGKNASTLLTQYSKTNKSLKSQTYKIKYKKQVAQLLAQVNPQLMWADLLTLTEYKDRYANSSTGVDAAKWIKAEVETYAKNNNRTDITAYLVKTGNNYKQSSVVVKVGDSNEAGVVIGAHMDTLSASVTNKPGADDDGSGSATVLETARSIISSGMQFKKPIYFIWYAAEEEGLVGSQYVVKDFAVKNIPVDAVLHFDLTGYAHNNESTMWLMDDYVDTFLVNYIEKLITTYVKKPVKHSQCGYACSDHASWTQAGYAAAIPAEAAYEDTNPSIHSSQDTMDKLSLDHMTDYLKLATAFAVEIAEPTA